MDRTDEPGATAVGTEATTGVREATVDDAAVDSTTWSKAETLPRVIPLDIKLVCNRNDGFQIHSAGRSHLSAERPLSESHGISTAEWPMCLTTNPSVRNDREPETTSCWDSEKYSFENDSLENWNENKNKKEDLTWEKKNNEIRSEEKEERGEVSDSESSRNCKTTDSKSPGQSSTKNIFDQEQYRPPASKPVVDFEKLKDWSEKNGDSLIDSIMLEENDFFQVLDEVAAFSTLETFHLLVSIILKATDFGAKENESLFLLSKVRSSSLISKGFLNFYTKLLTNGDDFFNVHESGRIVFIDSAKLLGLIVEKFPNSVDNKFPLYSMARLILSENKMSINALKYFDDRFDLIENSEINCQHAIGHDGQKVRRVSHSPADNFRDVIIVPKFDRDLAHAMKPYLIPNVIKGGFQDVYHYLDVHFRLLREDIVGPLRDGIKKFMFSPNGSQTDLRIYRGVKIVNFELKHTGILYRIKFDVNNLRNVNWNDYQGFKHGSLLYLSKNNFKNVLTATVRNSNPRDLAQGYVAIEFESQTVVFPSSEDFDVLESTALFEPYRHVLEVLLATNPARFPFKDIIVFCHPVNNPPKYLIDHEGASLFTLTNTRELIESNEDKPQSRIRKKKSGKVFLLDISSSVGDKETKSEDRRISVSDAEYTSGIKPSSPEEDPLSRGINILDENAWPAADVLGLEKMQLKALKHSLTSEVSIIQGPPGTGKTFLGMKVVEILLANWERWNANDKPILVVCYTNHALDQFMECISAFLKNGLIRVGGRSKSEILNKFNLMELKMSNSQRIPSKIICRGKNLKYELAFVKKRLEKYEAEINIIKTGIVDEDTLENFMTNAQFCSLKTFRPNLGRSSILIWLQIKESQTFRTHNAQLNEEQWSIIQDGYDVDNYIKKKQKYENSRELPLQIIKIKTIKKHIKSCLNRYHPMGNIENEKVSNVWTLSHKDRWRLYLSWLGRHETSIQGMISTKIKIYNDLVEDLKKNFSSMDEHIMQGAKVIGMTTTCAAKYRKVLSNIKPSVVLVEEAAEVLESHIIASLNPDCQHLILIGDHQQLRPSANVYKLETKYNLNVSLFERLVKNNITYVSLEKQHRMRPEIADFARITYPLLKDDVSVLKLDNIKGISSNVFFINHNMKETQNDHLSSASNDHEARLLVRLCRYLLQQGYSNKQITILTPYLGQVLRIKYYALMEEQTLQEVKVCSVDNYQGEENDIVLLSLVRSNFEEKIGFLKESNRLNVAMTRAKKGLFVIGNFDMLKLKSDFVRKICKLATEREIPLIGSQLCLSCQNHPSSKISVSTADDFDQAPEGGCRLPCRFRLSCGHTCTRSCHLDDTDHSQFQCLKPCPRILEPCQHSCQKACYETCRCEVMMLKTIPKCQHQHSMMCYVDLENFICPEKCLHVLPCGHRCARTCGERHTVTCKVPVAKTFDCGHETELFCSAINSAVCRVRCEDTLECGHPCEGDCSKCSNGERHVPCLRMCEKILPCEHPCSKMCSEDCGKCLVLVTKMIPKCGHFQEMECSTLPDDLFCRGKCLFQLPCGHTCDRSCISNRRCVDEHTLKCEVFVFKTFDCGHQTIMPCCKLNFASCDVRCRVTLKCGHPCGGFYGTCSIGKGHISCRRCARIPSCQSPVSKKRKRRHSPLLNEAVDDRYFKHVLRQDVGLLTGPQQNLQGLSMRTVDLAPSSSFRENTFRDLRVPRSGQEDHSGMPARARDEWQDSFHKFNLSREMHSGPSRPSSFSQSRRIEPYQTFDDENSVLWSRGQDSLTHSSQQEPRVRRELLEGNQVRSRVQWRESPRKSSRRVQQEMQDNTPRSPMRGSSFRRVSAVRERPMAQELRLETNRNVRPVPKRRFLEVPQSRELAAVPRGMRSSPPHKRFE